MRKALLFILLLCICANFFGCATNGNENPTKTDSETDKERSLQNLIQLVNAIGPVTDCSDATKQRIAAASEAALDEEYIWYLYPEKWNSDVLNKAIMHFCGYMAKEAACIEVKSELLRPASMEVNSCIVKIYYERVGSDTYDDIFIVQVTLDYSAQNQLGGYVRDTKKFEYAFNTIYEYDLQKAIASFKPDKYSTKGSLYETMNLS